MVWGIGVKKTLESTVMERIPTQLGEVVVGISASIKAG